MKLHTAYDEFMSACKADGLASKTIIWYQSILKPLLNQYKTRDIAGISTSELRTYIVDLRNRDTRYSMESAQRPAESGGLSDASINGHIRALHRFWRWMSEEYGIKNPMERIKRPPQLSSAIPRTVDLNDFEKMLRSLQATTEGRRDHALLAWLADTGCRVGGVEKLNIKDIDLIRRTAIVTEKGDKTRRIRFSRYTRAALLAWLADRPVCDHNHVFISLGNATYGNPLSYEGFYWALRRIAQRARVTSPVNPHAFRHGFGKAYIQNGGDLSTLSRLMGHTSIKTTHDFYALFNQRELDANHDKFSPLRDIAKKGS